MTLTIDTSNPLAHQDPFLNWLIEHGCEPANIYRVDVDDDRLTVFEYALDNDGRKFYDQAAGDAARREPYTVARRSECPIRGGVS